MFEQEVATKDGLVRMIRARSLDALNEQVQAAQNDVQAVSPDISGDPEPEVQEKPKRTRKVKVVPEPETAQEQADTSMEMATEVAEEIAATAKPE